MTTPNHRLNQGFSLLEMTVVLGIVAIMTAIVLMNLPQMKGGLSIDVVAQEVAIYIRGAQVYSRATKTADGENYRSYGLHFESSSENSRNRKFFLWADADGSVKDSQDYVYSDFDDSEPLETYELPSGFSISRLVCGGEYPTDLDIVFKLPDPEANFGSVDVGGCKNETLVGVCLKSPNSEQFRLVKTFANGQIMVENGADSKTACQSGGS